VIHPSEHHGGVVETHHDHRLAMSLALIGLAVEDVVISQPDVVSKSWPEYWSMLDSLK
jgi:3-phosphoshikimate 1-carboxyvinyltransferase